MGRRAPSAQATGQRGLGLIVVGLLVGYFIGSLPISSGPAAQQQHPGGSPVHAHGGAAGAGAAAVAGGAKHDPSAPRLLIGVFSILDRVDRRMLLRSTYMRHRPCNVDFLFVIGNVGGKNGVYDYWVKHNRTRGLELLELAEAEHRAYNDVLLLSEPENMNGGKSYFFLRWAAAHAGGYDYVAKMDDDVFLHPRALSNRLAALPRERVYFGRPLALFNKTANPHFHQGMLYVLSADLVQRVAAELTEAGAYEGEDVLAGRWMYKLGLPPSQWHNASADEFYESLLSASGPIGTKFGWWKRPSYTNETLGIHLLKSQYSVVHAYAALKATLGPGCAVT